MSVDEYMELRFECQSLLVSAQAAFDAHDIPAPMHGYGYGDPCLQVTLPAESGYRTISTTVPPGITGTRRTESDGAPSMFQISLTNMEGGEENLGVFSSRNDLLAFVHALLDGDTPSSILAGITD